MKSIHLTERETDSLSLKFTICLHKTCIRCSREEIQNRHCQSIRTIMICEGWPVMVKISNVHEFCALIRIWAQDGHLVEPSFKYLWYLNSVNPNQVSYTIEMSFARDWDWPVFYNMPLPHTGAHACRDTHASDNTLVAKGVLLTIETQFSDNHTSSSIMFSPVKHRAFLTCSTALMIGSLYFETL